MKSKENCRLSDIEYENCIKANKEGRWLQCALSINREIKCGNSSSHMKSRLYICSKKLTVIERMKGKLKKELVLFQFFLATKTFVLNLNVSARYTAEI